MPKEGLGESCRNARGIIRAVERRGIAMEKEDRGSNRADESVQRGELEGRKCPERGIVGRWLGMGDEYSG